jgi:1-aminocyclopropane-1-carboxylate deaminase
MVLDFCIPSPLQRLLDPEIAGFGVEIWVKRDDLIHPQISGNKWRKLKYNIEIAKKEGYAKILTFGGAFSNHIYATAAAGQILGLHTIGIIRGERVEPLNSTLAFAESVGMELHFIDRETYRQKNSQDQLDSYQKSFSPVYIIPEGGANSSGVKGCEEIVDEIQIPFNYICCACGTGTTLSGIINSLSPFQKAIGFPVLKGGEFLHDEIVKQLKCPKISNFHLETDYHFGGYAKWNAELESFMERFEKVNLFRLEPVYTGKLFYGLYDLIKKGYFPKGSRIVAVHTGGLR